MPRPKLRTVEKYNPPYPLNRFPAGFAFALGREAAYIMATRKTSAFEGSDWEAVFANCIGADWTPSNVGLDDVRLGQTAWGAKTVKSSNPHLSKRVRLISGRNSINYSFGVSDPTKTSPNKVGEMVLEIWNERVDGVKQHFQNLRTVVLIKSKDDLTKLAIFETDTLRYEPKGVRWNWNQNGNLEGHIKGEHKFTWQPHGAQFTIIEEVPSNRLLLEIKHPGLIDKGQVLNGIGFNEDWVRIINPDSSPRNREASVPIK